MPISFDLVMVILLVIYLEGILSIDNAAVLGAMVSALPSDQIIPWPRPLQFLSKPMDWLIGKQRSAALKVGLLGAYIGRGAMLFTANFVIHNPWLKLLGGLYLVKLAIENLGEPEPGEEKQVELGRTTQKGFWSIVLAVELADLAFSLDNVVAVVAISSNLWLVMFGVAMGILTMRFAAGIFTKLILREPILKPAAYILVFNIGVELLLEELTPIQINEVATFMISAATLVLAVAYAHLTPLRIFRPVLLWLAEGMANVNELFDWALKPVTGLLHLIIRTLRAVTRNMRTPSSSETAKEKLLLPESGEK